MRFRTGGSNTAARLPSRAVAPYMHVGCGAESQKQYWQVKSRYRDTIIFFKVGKFYELYEVIVTSPIGPSCTLACKRPGFQGLTSGACRFHTRMMPRSAATCWAGERAGHRNPSLSGLFWQVALAVGKQEVTHAAASMQEDDHHGSGALPAGWLPRERHRRGRRAPGVGRVQGATLALPVACTARQPCWLCA